MEKGKCGDTPEHSVSELVPFQWKHTIPVAFAYPCNADTCHSGSHITGVTRETPLGLPFLFQESSPSTKVMTMMFWKDGSSGR